MSFVSSFKEVDPKRAIEKSDPTPNTPNSNKRKPETEPSSNSNKRTNNSSSSEKTTSEGSNGNNINQLMQQATSNVTLENMYSQTYQMQCQAYLQQLHQSLSAMSPEQCKKYLQDSLNNLQTSLNDLNKWYSSLRDKEMTANTDNYKNYTTQYHYCSTQLQQVNYYLQYYNQSSNSPTSEASSRTPAAASSNDTRYEIKVPAEKSKNQFYEHGYKQDCFLTLKNSTLEFIKKGKRDTLKIARADHHPHEKEFAYAGFETDEKLKELLEKAGTFANKEGLWVEDRVKQRIGYNQVLTMSAEVYVPIPKGSDLYKKTVDTHIKICLFLNKNQHGIFNAYFQDKGRIDESKGSFKELDLKTYRNTEKYGQMF